MLNRVAHKLSTSPHALSCKIMSHHCDRNDVISCYFFCSKHIICLHFYHKYLKCPPLALTHTIKWWCHYWMAHAWCHGLASPTE